VLIFGLSVLSGFTAAFVTGPMTGYYEKKIRLATEAGSSIALDALAVKSKKCWSLHGTLFMGMLYGLILTISSAFLLSVLTS